MIFSERKADSMERRNPTGGIRPLDPHGSLFNTPLIPTISSSVN